jgi:hypothetical protein
MDLAWIPDATSARWNVINAVGTWIAGIATFFTAIVALHLASRDRRLDLQLSATIGSAPEGYMPFLLLSVRNAGRRVATIRAIGFTVGLLPSWSPILARRNYSVIPSPTLKGMQKVLQDGDVFEPVQQVIPVGFTSALAVALAKPRWLSVRTVRFWALTSIDERRSVRISKALRDYLLELAADAEQATDSSGRSTTDPR